MNDSTSSMTGLFRSLLRRSLLSFLFRCRSRDSRWLDSLYRKHGQASAIGTVAVDLGCGVCPRNPFECEKSFGVDIRESEAVISSNLILDPLPFANDSLRVVTAYDVLEHIPRVLIDFKNGQRNTRFPFVDLMNEIDRCLQPGGLFFASFPCWPWPMAYQDPTHANIMTEDTLRQYFSGSDPWAKIYGFNGSFLLLEEAWIGGHYNALLRQERG